MVFELQHERDTVKVSGEFARCEVRMEVGERVSRIGPTRTVIVPGATEELVATTIGSFETTRGHGYRFMAMARIASEAAATTKHSAAGTFTTAWRVAERLPEVMLLSARTQGQRGYKLVR